MKMKSSEKLVIGGHGKDSTGGSVTFGEVTIPANTKWAAKYVRHGLLYKGGSEAGTLSLTVVEDSTTKYQDYARGHGTSIDSAEGEPVSEYIGPFSDSKTLRLAGAYSAVDVVSALAVIERVALTPEEKHNATITAE